MLERRNISIQEITDPELTTRAGVDETTKRKFIMGYASLNNLESRQITEKINGVQTTFVERIDKNAWNDTDMNDVMYNVDHNPALMVARTSAGNLKLSPNERGLFFRAELPNTTVANDLHENVNVGNYKENSFAFQVREDRWEKRGAMLHRTILSISRLFDVSSVIRGAYQADILFTRSLDESQIEVEKAPEPETTPVEVQGYDGPTADIDFKIDSLKKKIL